MYMYDKIALLFTKSTFKIFKTKTRNGNKFKHKRCMLSNMAHKHSE